MPVQEGYTAEWIYIDGYTLTFSFDGKAPRTVDFSVYN